MTKIESSALTSQEQAWLNAGLAIIEARRPRNAKLSGYYDAVERVKSLGIAIPANLRNIGTVVGWPAKAVDTRLTRLRHQGFVVPDGTENPMGVDELWADNSMELESAPVHLSSLLHGLSVGTVTKGDVQSGEPEVLYSFHEAGNATILWDARRRQAAAAVAITERRDTGDPSVVILSTPTQVVTLRWRQSGYWVAEAAPHDLRRTPATLFVRKPRIGRRFGMPVLSRPVLSLTDSMIRSLIRAEVAGEFFSVPQRWALNVSDTAFSSGAWQAIIGRFLALSQETDDGGDPIGNKPEVGQFPQVSLQGSTDQMREFAMLFSGESNIPLGYLGVRQDNPPSADAIRVSETPLIEDVEADQGTFGWGWSDLSRLGVMVRDGLDTAPTELSRLKSLWRDAATPTRQSQTANVVALIQAGALPPVSRVTYEQLGYDSTTIDRLMADARRQQGAAALAALTQAVQALPAPQEQLELTARTEV